jgi:hypothetical protein
MVGNASRRAAGREKGRLLCFDDAVSVGTKINIDFVFMWSQIGQSDKPQLDQPTGASRYGIP